MHQDAEFRKGVREAIGDPRIRRTFRARMDLLMAKRRSAFPDPEEWDDLRRAATGIRADNISRLPKLLEQLEKNCTRNGIRVHWAETADDANQTVLEIMRGHDALQLIKGKSMVSEEMGLNGYLAARGIDCLESDLGEFIVQLAGERPSHIIAPAIHKDRAQVARLFKENFPDVSYTEDIKILTGDARRLLRRKFLEAPVGLTGVNFAVAETGTLCLVENEGNGRLCTTLPKVHIAVMGIEKVVEKLSDIPPLLDILVRSATGQSITTYFNMISSPRRRDERDGPEEVHLVLLDNGRSRICQDRELDATLRCIRCGACMNHCPVYSRLGGHAYPGTIPGPIGALLEPQIAGLDRLGMLPTASTLCGACSEVCPVGIPIPELLNRLRAEGVKRDPEGIAGSGSRRRFREALVWRLWQLIFSRPQIYCVAVFFATRVPAVLPRLFGPWIRSRSLPIPAEKNLHDICLKRGVEHE